MKTMHVLAAALFAAFAAAADGGDEDAHAKGYISTGRRNFLRRSSGADSSSSSVRSRTLFKSSSIPEKWDSRDYGWITPVKNQGNVGSCWAFAALATVETQLKKSGRGEWDLSEKNMVNLHGLEAGFNDGGSIDHAFAYLMRWCGPVAETNDAYVTVPSNWTGSSQFNPPVHIQNCVFVPGREDVYDNDMLKKAIMDYGAAMTSMSWSDSYVSSKSNYYCNVFRDLDHAIAVVGWDDSYPSNNFSTLPPGNGAWLIKNSWGTASGDKGYYHVSYYDINFAAFYSAVFIPATDEEDYSAVYGYDFAGWFGDYSGWTYGAAAFTSSWNEEIAAVGLFSVEENVTYEVSIYTNVVRAVGVSQDDPDPLEGGSLACTFKSVVTNFGYSTIHLPTPLKIADGANFAVVYEQLDSVSNRHACCFSCTDTSGSPYLEVYPVEGNTYLGDEIDGELHWRDLATTDDILCLRAYTRRTVEEREADVPAENAAGDDAVSWLAATNSSLYAQTMGTFGAFANLAGANGRSLYASWLWGFAPSTADDSELRLSISVADGTPDVTWAPDLGSARTYTLYGTPTLSSPVWTPVSDLSTTSARFFRLSISP